MIVFDSSVKISLFYLILSNLDNRFLRVFDPIYRISPRKPVLLSIHKTLTGMTKTIKWLDLPQYESAYKINVVIRVFHLNYLQCSHSEQIPALRWEEIVKCV